MMCVERKYPIKLSKFKELIEPFLEASKQKSGRPVKVDNYKFFCGVLYILRTGVSWRDLPEEYGNWHTIYTRWSEQGVFWKLLYKLQSTKSVLLDIIFVDGSLISTHRHGSVALKKEGASINW